MKKQLEFSGNFQHFSSGKFMRGDSDTANLVDRIFSNYLYSRVAFGLTKELTMSVEAGYFLNKTEYALNKKDTISSKGISDLVLFPRYNVYNHCGEKVITDITVGMGMKIPIGTYNDSFVVYQHPVTLKKYYTTSPPTVQPTSGSTDLIFYGFLFQGFNKCKLNAFMNVLYIKKGWNPLGQKFGDFASVGLFVSRSFFDRLGLTLQVRGEWIDRMKYDRNVDMLALYNMDVNSTGSKKVFLVPQINFTYKDLTVYGMYEYPLYQYLNRVQIASQTMITAGINYRINL